MTERRLLFGGSLGFGSQAMKLFRGSRRVGSLNAMLNIVAEIDVDVAFGVEFFVVTVEVGSEIESCLGADVLGG